MNRRNLLLGSSTLAAAPALTSLAQVPQSLDGFRLHVAGIGPQIDRPAI